MRMGIKFRGGPNLCLRRLCCLSKGLEWSSRGLGEERRGKHPVLLVSESACALVGLALLVPKGGRYKG